MMMAAVGPQLSKLLLILLVTLTGTAWFAVLHPDFVWRLVRSRTDAEDMPAYPGWLIRLTAAAFGVAGVMALLNLDWP